MHAFHLSLLRGDKVSCFLLTLRLLCAIRRSRLRLPCFGLIPYLHASSRRAGGGVPSYILLFSRKVGTCISYGLSGRPSEGNQMSSTVRNIGAGGGVGSRLRVWLRCCCLCWWCVVVWVTYIRKKVNDDSGRKTAKAKAKCPALLSLLI